jgi:site-specific DNA-methyltransferase (adenine-specific)
MTYTVFHGNNLEILPTIPDNSIDSIVTDPPYELGFMGKKWDASGIAYNVALWQECLRVLKPGGHLLAFGGTRTYHRMTCAIEDAGFEIRDSIHWIYGSGFPKSMDISKAIDKAAGAERQIVGTKRVSPKGVSAAETRSATAAGAFGGETKEVNITIPATDEAKQWEGWGTALKPAHEPIVLARKPPEGTILNNINTHNTGALNIDACRIPLQPDDTSAAGHRTATFGTQDTISGGDGSGGWTQDEGGRWPANVIHDGSDEIVSQFPDTAAGNRPKTRNVSSSFNANTQQQGSENAGRLEPGSAARFFAATPYGDVDEASFLYCAKPSKAERNAGLDGMEQRSAGIKNSSGRGFSETDPHRDIKAANFHPTVKPLALMRYLCRLITPPNGTVLDPFAGSGTTLVAAVQEQFNAIGIELTDDYLPIIHARLKWAEEQATLTPQNDQLAFDL